MTSEVLTLTGPIEDDVAVGVEYYPDDDTIIKGLAESAQILDKMLAEELAD